MSRWFLLRRYRSSSRSNFITIAIKQSPATRVAGLSFYNMGIGTDIPLPYSHFSLFNQYG
jgi:hypothetical protein